MNSVVSEFCRSVKFRWLHFTVELFHFKIFFVLIKNARNTFFLAFQNTKARRLTLKYDKMRAILRKTMSLSLCNTLDPDPRGG